MARDYELMYIVRPDVDDEGLSAAIADVEALVGGQGGEVVATTSWGKRRLAYEIDNLRDGHYVILQVRLEPERVRDLERVLHINETVLRHLVTLYVPKDESAVEVDGEVARDGAGREGGRRGDRDRDREPSRAGAGRRSGDDDAEGAVTALGEELPLGDDADEGAVEDE